MSITLPLPFSECLAPLRRELTPQGLEIESDGNDKQCDADCMGTQLTDLRCLFVFDPLSLLHHSYASHPAAALATLTLRADDSTTTVTVHGSGISYRKARRALARCLQSMAHLRHAA